METKYEERYLVVCNQCGQLYAPRTPKMADDKAANHMALYGPGHRVVTVKRKRDVSSPTGVSL